jgi:hypothetical protein
VRTPRGLLATLGATVSLVAAAACVLVFTSTLVAVKGWPGLSDAPEGAPVALAPVDRPAASGGRDGGSAGSPVVLGAPATTTAPPAPVGLGSAPASGGSETGSVAGERIESGSAPTTSTPVVTEQGASSPVAVTPVGIAPTGTEGSIVPAVLPPAETALPTTPQSTHDSDTGYMPSERSVTVNAIPEMETETYATTDAGENADGLEPETGSREFARTPATAWPQDDEIPGDEAPAWGDDGEEPATSDEPSRETARGVQPDERAEAPETAEEPEPETALEAKPETAPEPKPESTPEPKPESTPEPKPESTPEPKPETTPEPAPDGGEKSEPEPCPPAAEPAPEPEPCPPAEPETQPAPEQAPPAPEQAPAAPPC